MSGQLVVTASVLGTQISWHSVHRDSDKRLRNKSKSGHEERDLAFQKCLVAGRDGQAFDARYLLEFLKFPNLSRKRVQSPKYQ